MDNSLSDKSNSVRQISKRHVVFVLVMALVISLGAFSVKTTKSVKVSFYPLGEYRINIRNEKGEPISGATLNVFEKGNRNFAFDFPVDNYGATNGLVSDTQGNIIARHIPGGLEIGSVCHNLFWIYLICSAYEPEFDFEISANGYETSKFSTDFLFYNSTYKNQNNGEITLPLSYFPGKTLDAPIYKLTLTLKK